MRIFYKNNQMRITDITVNTKIKNLLTMTIESKTKTTLKLITIGQQKKKKIEWCVEREETEFQMEKKNETKNKNKKGGLCF